MPDRRRKPRAYGVKGMRRPARYWPWIAGLVAAWASAAVILRIILLGIARNDLAGAPAREVIGTVVRVAFPGRHTRWGPATPQAILRVGGQEVPAIVMDTARSLHPGQRMRFTVRIGRSGQWYVEAASPAPPDP
ncbi:MAG: hypothetical protein ACP5VE_02285 [Chthonomonadales bacterium]